MRSILTPRSATLLAVAVAVAMTAACGSNATGDTDTTGTNNVPCTITMSGARSQPLTCSGVTADQTTGDNSSLFGLQGSGSTDTLGVAIGLTGAPEVHTYTSDTDASPAVTLITPVGAWATGPGDGSLSLTFTSVKQLDSGAGLTTYEVHGTLTMTMIAEVSDGSLGSVSVTVKF